VFLWRINETDSIRNRFVHISHTIFRYVSLFLLKVSTLSSCTFWCIFMRRDAEFTKICQVIATLIYTWQFNDHCTPTPTRSTACNWSETQDILIVVKNSSIGLVGMNDFLSNALILQVLRSSKNFKKMILCVNFQTCTNSERQMSSKKKKKITKAALRW
jgi:hypothetical protein